MIAIAIIGSVLILAQGSHAQTLRTSAGQPLTEIDRECSAQVGAARDRAKERVEDLSKRLGEVPDLTSHG